MKDTPKTGPFALPAFDLPKFQMPRMPRLDLPTFALPGMREKPGATPDVDIREQTEAELEALRSDFQKRAHAEQDRFTDATDSEYWVAVCFHTRQQKEEFLAGMKLDDLGDKYIDGVEAARRLKILLTPVGEVRRTRAPGRKLTELALPADDEA